MTGGAGRGGKEGRVHGAGSKLATRDIHSQDPVPLWLPSPPLQVFAAGRCDCGHFHLSPSVSLVSSGTEEGHRTVHSEHSLKVSLKCPLWCALDGVGTERRGSSSPTSHGREGLPRMTVLDVGSMRPGSGPWLFSFLHLPTSSLGHAPLPAQAECLHRSALSGRSLGVPSALPTMPSPCLLPLTTA